MNLIRLQVSSEAFDDVLKDRVEKLKEDCRPELVDNAFYHGPESDCRGSLCLFFQICQQAFKPLLILLLCSHLHIHPLFRLKLHKRALTQN